MFKTKVIFFISAIFAYCESASILEHIHKCKVTDDECLRDNYRNILQEITDSGIPDQGIPRVDPFDVKDMEITAMEMLKIKMPKGTVKGYKTCKSEKFHTDMETLTTSIELLCDEIVIEGDYKLETTPTLDALLGGIKITGEGQGSLKIEKLQLNMENKFEYKKLEDCEYHAVVLPDQSSYEFKILGKMSATGNSLSVGSVDVSEVAFKIFNENWEFISRLMGKTVLNQGIGVFMHYVNKFFASVPMNALVIDDLSAYAS
ncbi:uncharacterized protein LOC142975998 [Anticarsia gemmatalis]|uniref:uncharacterized protein LOC142975998 n=1 Tax=Anticarsia gemmatalis TaxID=129554 RepID=UPI003F7756BA